MSEVAEAPAPEAPPAEPAPEAAPSDVKPVEAQGGQGPNEDRQKDDAKLNPLQRFAKQAREKREARFVTKDTPAEQPAGDAKPDEKAPAAEAKDKAEPAAKGPERDEHGRFLPADGKPKADAKAAAEPKETPKPAPEPPPDAAVEAAKDKLEAAGGKVPEQKAAETDKQYELRISKLLVEKKQRDAELLETKKLHSQLAAEKQKLADELEERRKREERLRGNEIDEADFEAATGRTFESFVKGLAASEVKYKPKPQLAPEVTAELEAIRALKAELQADKERILNERKAAEEAKARAEREASTKQAQEADAGTVKSWLDENADKYPYLASVENPHIVLRDAIYAEVRRTKGSYDPDEVAEGIEKALESKLGTIASSERAIMALLRNPKTRDLVAKQLGTVTPNATDKQPPSRNQGDQKAAAANGPPTLTNKVTQEVPAPVERELTPEEERLAYHARMRAANKAREAALKARLNPGS